MIDRSPMAAKPSLLIVDDEVNVTRTLQMVFEQEGYQVLPAYSAAEAIGISRSKIYELLASGELPSVRIGASVRVPVEALRAWIAEQLDTSRS